MQTRCAKTHTLGQIAHDDDDDDEITYFTMRCKTRKTEKLQAFCPNGLVDYFSLLYGRGRGSPVDYISQNALKCTSSSVEFQNFPGS